MEHGDGEPGAHPPGRDRALRLIQRERGREDARLLRRVGVAEHHLESLAVRTQAGPDRGQRHDVVEDLGHARELGPGFEQADDVETAGEPGIRPARQGVGRGHIRGLPREAQDRAGGRRPRPATTGSRPSRGGWRRPPRRAPTGHGEAPGRADEPRATRDGSRRSRPGGRGWRARRPPAGRRRPRAGTRAGPPGRAGTRPRTDSPRVVARAWPPAVRRSGRAAGDAARRAGCATAPGLAPGRGGRLAPGRVAAPSTRGRPDRWPRASARSAGRRPRTRARRGRGRCAAAASVTSAVTAGLPSRSPPTQVAHRKRTSLPAVRATRGNVVKIVRSNSAIVARTSSSGVGAARRTGSVSHRLVISSARRRSRSSRTRPAHRGSSSPSSRSPIRHRCSTTARRFASVGCAVRTSVTSTGRPIGAGTPSARRAASQIAHALSFLRHVDQLEERGERARHGQRVRGRDAGDDALDRGPSRLRGLGVQADRRPSKSLHAPVQAGSAVRADGIAEQGREQPHIGPEGVGNRPPCAVGARGSADAPTATPRTRRG